MVRTTQTCRDDFIEISVAIITIRRFGMARYLWLALTVVSLFLTIIILSHSTLIVNPLSLHSLQLSNATI